MAGLADFLQFDYFKVRLYGEGFEFLFIFFRRTTPFYLTGKLSVIIIKKS